MADAAPEAATEPAAAAASDPAVENVPPPDAAAATSAAAAADSGKKKAAKKRPVLHPMYSSPLIEQELNAKRRYKTIHKTHSYKAWPLNGATASISMGIIKPHLDQVDKEEEEELEPAPKPVTIKGNVTLKDAKGDVFAEVHKDDATGTVIGAESVIIIKNAKGKEVVRITRGYVTVKNFNVEEIVQIMRGVVSVKTMAGKEMVHVEKGEIYIEDFDGEVIVNNLADVNKLDEEMSLKNL